MKTVYKYHVPVSNEPISIELPAGAKLCDAAMQGQSMFLWAQVDTDVTSTQFIEVQVIGTGHALALRNATFFKTVHISDLGLVLHVFVDSNATSLAN